MSSNLTFSAHIDKVYNKVRQMGGWILRTFNSRSKDILVPLWISLVQPHLDYCSQLWAPSKHTEISKLESLLRTYTNNIKVIRHLDFWERIKVLNMYSIQRRMERYKIIYIFKILEKLVPNVGIQQYHNIRLGRFLRVPKINNSAPKTIQSIKESSFTVQGPQLFNSLPKHIRDMTDCTVLKFKSMLDKYLTTIPDEPRVSGYIQLSVAYTNSIIHQRPK